MIIDMKTVKGVTLNGQTVKYIHDLNNNQLWPYNGPGPQPTNDQFYIKNLSSNANTVTVKSYSMSTYIISDSTINLSISQDNINWINIGTSSFTIQPNQIMYVKSLSAVPWFISPIFNFFTATDVYSIGGDIMTLLNYSNLQGYDCRNMFGGLVWLPIAGIGQIPNPDAISKLIRFENDFKLSSVLEQYCYTQMFSDCTGLTSLPDNLLQSITLEQDCYSGMFSNTGITSIPNNFLPATTLVDGCYEGMFMNCTSLTSVPSNLLHATNLAGWCYSNMFSGCTSLTTAPDLPAITLANNWYNCYSGMFSDCTNLNYIKAMFTTDISSTTGYTRLWLSNTSATGTFVKNVNATWIRSDASGTNGWTIQTVNP